MYNYQQLRLIGTLAFLTASSYMLAMDEGSGDAKELSKRVLSSNVTMYMYDERKLAEFPVDEAENCPRFEFSKGLPVTPAVADVFDARGQNHTFATNGFEFVDFSGNKEFTEVLEAFLNSQASEQEIDELRDIYAVHLKKEIESWWIKNHPKDEGQIEWVPLYKRSGTLRDTSGVKNSHHTESQFVFTHVDYYSAKDAINYFSSQEKYKVDARLSDEKTEILCMANVWAPLNEICGGFPLAVVDTQKLQEENLPKIIIVPPPYKSENGEFVEVNPSFCSRYLKADPSEIEYNSLSEWKRGEVVIFNTIGTPHTAYSDGTGKVRNSIEVRGAIIRKSAIPKPF